MPEGWFKVPYEIEELMTLCGHRDAVIVYVMLCLHCRNTDNCWPSNATIAKKTGMSDRQVRKMLKVLVESRVISITYRHGTNIYTLHGRAELCSPSTAQGSPKREQPSRMGGTTFPKAGNSIPPNESALNENQESYTKNQDAVVKQPASMPASEFYGTMAELRKKVRGVDKS